VAKTERPGRVSGPFGLVEPGELGVDEFPFVGDSLRGVGAGDVEDDATVDFAGVHAREDVVDVFDLLCCYVGVDHTFSCEGECFGQIQARAHDGAANGEGLEHYLKDGKGEGAGGKAVERDGGARAGHADGLGEGGERGRGHEDCVGSADFLLKEGCGILLLGVDGEFGAERTSELELLVGDVDCGYVEAHRLGVLDGQVTEAADTGDDNPVAGLGIGGLEALVHRDAGADDGRDFYEAYVLGKVSYVVRIGYRVIRIATVLGVAAEFCLGAAGLLSSEAVDALAAGGVEPDDAYAIAFLDGFDVLADAGDEAYAFVAGDERGCGLDGPVAFCSVQVRVTDAAGFHLDLDLFGAGLRDGHLLDDQGLAEFSYNCRFHCLCHFKFLSVRWVLLRG
jgi:hypothetical protein